MYRTASLSYLLCVNLIVKKRYLYLLNTNIFIKKKENILSILKMQSRFPGDKVNPNLFVD